MSIVFFLAV